MSFAQDTGYLPTPLSELMNRIRTNVNDTFQTGFTEASFVGTNWYKYLYAAAQEMQRNEIKTSEIFQKLQEYINTTNDKILRPSTTIEGLIDGFAKSGLVASVKKPAEANAGKLYLGFHLDEDIVGKQAVGWIRITSYAALVSGTDDTITVGATVFTAQSGGATPGDATFQAATSNDITAQSLATQINEHATAGALVTARAIGSVVRLSAKAFGTSGNSIALAYTDNDTNAGATVSGANLSGGLARDTGAYATLKTQIVTLIKTYVAAGMVTVGDESEAVALSNGQSFDFKYELPKIMPILWRMTAVKSLNTVLPVPSEDTIKELIASRIAERYRMGWDIEPQRYFNLGDAPWAASCVLEYSLDNEATWVSTVYHAEYDDLIKFDEVEDIDVVIS